MTDKDEPDIQYFTEQMTSLLKKTFPEIKIHLETEYNYPNDEYGRIIIKYSNVKDSVKLKKEIYNCFMYLCSAGTTTNMGQWFRIGKHYYQYDVINECADPEFQSKLKELCLKYDIENGISDDGGYSGFAIYEFYCDEDGIYDDYLTELYKLEEREAEPVKEVEYYISEEEIKLGDLVCDGNNLIPIGFMVGNIECDYVIDGAPGCALVSGTMIVKTPLKKLGVREKKERVDND